MSKVDWSKAPDGYDEYADGKFWKKVKRGLSVMNESPCFNYYAYNLNGLSDYEKRPEKQVTCCNVSVVNNTSLQASSHFVDDNAISITISDFENPNPTDVAERQEGGFVNESLLAESVRAECLRNSDSVTLPISLFNNCKVESKQEKDGNKYHREIIGFCGTMVEVDVYRVLDAFKTESPAIDHAVKKMLCTGIRGHKDYLTDIDNAIESLQEAKLLHLQKQEINKA